MRHPGLGQHVAIKAAQPAVASDVVQDAIAAETLVHHPHRSAARSSLEPPGELVWPAAMRVERRDVGIGERIAECHDPSSLRSGDDINAADKIPIPSDLA